MFRIIIVIVVAVVVVMVSRRRTMPQISVRCAVRKFSASRIYPVRIKCTGTKDTMLTLDTHCSKDFLADHPRDNSWQQTKTNTKRFIWSEINEELDRNLHHVIPTFLCLSK